MNKSLLLATLSLAVLPLAQAEDYDAQTSARALALMQKEDGEKAGKASKKAPANDVGKALKKFKFFNNKKPNLKAQYYIFLQSGSECPPCRAEMPQIAESYKEILDDKRLELILSSADASEGNALQLLELGGKKNKIPATLGNAKGIEKIPGYKRPDGIPAATIVDASGKVLADGHGSITHDWKAVIEKAQSENNSDE